MQLKEKLIKIEEELEEIQFIINNDFDGSFNDFRRSLTLIKKQNCTLISLVKILRENFGEKWAVRTDDDPKPEPDIFGR